MPKSPIDGLQSLKCPIWHFTENLLTTGTEHSFQENTLLDVQQFLCYILVIEWPGSEPRPADSR